MGRILVTSLIAGMLLAAGQPSGAQGAEAARKGAMDAPSHSSLRYANPLSVDDSIGMGDPTVLRFKDTY